METIIATAAAPAGVASVGPNLIEASSSQSQQISVQVQVQVPVPTDPDLFQRQDVRCVQSVIPDTLKMEPNETEDDQSRNKGKGRGKQQLLNPHFSRASSVSRSQREGTTPTGLGPMRGREGVERPSSRYTPYPMDHTWSRNALPFISRPDTLDNYRPRATSTLTDSEDGTQPPRSAVTELEAIFGKPLFPIDFGALYKKNITPMAKAELFENPCARAPASESEKRVLPTAAIRPGRPKSPSLLSQPGLDSEQEIWYPASASFVTCPTESPTLLSNLIQDNSSTDGENDNPTDTEKQLLEQQTVTESGATNKSGRKVPIKTEREYDIQNFTPYEPIQTEVIVNQIPRSGNQTETTQAVDRIKTETIETEEPTANSAITSKIKEEHKN